MTTNIYSEIANILEECVQGKKTVEASLECLWPYESFKNDFINEIVHFFRHYSDDADIRRKDLKYAEYQNQQVLEYISLLKGKSQNENSPPDSNS